MKALVLNGAAALADMGRAVEAALVARLRARGYAVTQRDLPSLEIPACRGDFGCWTVTPGVCVQPGPHRLVARELIGSDLAVWITPITFGGYSSSLKRQLDHGVPLISPHFTTVDGETHHQPRYERFPSVLAVGLLERADEEAARVFARLVRRNALNMHVPHVASVVLTRGELPEMAALLPGWFADLAASQPPGAHADPLALGPRTTLAADPARRALVLMGSPRGNASVSASLAGHLARLLAERGLAVTIERIHGMSRVDPELRGLAARLAGVDVVALATPLYVDSLPAPVTEAFEMLARCRAALTSSRPRFLALLNCGFPEAVQNDTALAICRLFARDAGLDWIGGLGIGAGGMLAGKALAKQGGRARAVARALALTADAIAQGRVVPEEAQQMVRKLPIPRWLYRVLGDWGFRREARKHGTRSRLGERPYAA